ncbi:MAG: hypothetical protein R3C02_02650 [Planctomycetaceae bacterium]
MHKLLLNRRGQARANARSWIWSLVCIVATFHLVMLTWILFRSPTIEVATDYLTGIVTLRGGLEFQRFRWLSVAFYVALLLAVEVPQYVRVGVSPARVALDDQRGSGVCDAVTDDRAAT